MAVSGNVLVLGTALLLLRFLGQGMLVHTSFTLLGRWFTRERGRAVSVATLGLNTGEALLPAAVIALTATLGWRAAWGLPSVVLVLAASGLALLFGRERRPNGDVEHPVDGIARWSRGEALRDRYFPLVVLTLSAPALTGNTVFFNQLHLADLHGWPSEVLASALTVYAVATVVSTSSEATSSIAYRRCEWCRTSCYRSAADCSSRRREPHGAPSSSWPSTGSATDCP
jgi:MFS family permease